jgi:hypothetical protein
VEVTPWNLVGYSEQFDNAYWDNYSLTITANSTTAPNGTATADTFTSTANLPGVMYKLNQQSAGTFTISAYVKAGNFNLVRVGITDNGVGLDRISYLNLSTLAITNFGSAVGSIESVGNGWYRFIVTFTSTGDFNVIYGLQLPGTSGQYAYFWGAQINIGSTAKPYFPTTDRLNVPRLTYQNGGGVCPSLLLEKQSTNLFTYSEQFDNVDWTKLNVTVSANSTTSPDGTINADTLTPTTTNGVHRIQQDKATASQVFTQSIFAKANGYNFIALENGGEVAYFNISTGVVGTVSAGTASTQNMGNGWYRCIFTATASNAKSYFYVANADNSPSFAGDATSGIFVWGCQFE